MSATTTLTFKNYNSIATTVEDRAWNFPGSPFTTAPTGHSSVSGTSGFAPVGISYSNLLSTFTTGANVDGFVINPSGFGNLYINTGTTSAPNFRLLNFTATNQIATASTDPTVINVGTSTDNNPLTANDNGLGNLVFLITGVFYNAVKLSGGDGRLFWLPPTDTSGTITAFGIQAIDNNNGAYDSTDSIGFGTGTNARVDVIVAAVNDAPTINGGATAVYAPNENQSAVGTIVITDADGGVGLGVFSLGGADSALFGITGNGITGGILTFNPAPNFETPTDVGANGVYNVTVTYNDGGTSNNLASQAVTITVANVNEAPVNSVPGPQTANGSQQVVFSGANAITVSDPDGAGAILDSVLIADSGGGFTLNATSVAASGATNNSGSTFVAFTGTATQINTALQGLTYTGSTLPDTLFLATTDAASLSDNDSITINLGSAAVTSVSVPPASSYNAGDNLDFTVTFNQAVAVDTTGGMPQIGITLDSGAVTANYFSGSPGTSVVFRYTVGAGQTDVNGIVVGALTLNGGTINATTGGAAILTLNNVGATTAILIDTTTPAVPSGLDLAATDDTGTSSTDDLTMNTTALTISGAGENASTVTLFNDVNNDGSYLFANDGATLGTAPVAAGAWSIDAALAQGVHNVRAFATDGAGNVSAASSALAITVDTTPPVLTVTLDANITTDDIINAAEALSTVAITGTVGGADAAFGDTVNLVVNNVTYTGTVNGSGNAFSINVAGSDLAADADSTIDASVSKTDAAGNTGTGTDTETYTVDTAAPAAPSLLDLVISSDTGSSNTDNITNDNTPTITGSGENGATVTLSNVGGSLGTALVSGGVWSITISPMTPLSDGVHSLTATQTDVAGNISAASSALAITVDTMAPATPTLALAEDTGVSAVDGITNNGTVNVSGIETGASWEYTTNGNAITPTFTTGIGTSFILDANGPAYAFADIQVRQTDVAGNISGTSGNGGAITVDTIAPTAITGLDLDAADDSGISSTDNITNPALVLNSDPMSISFNPALTLSGLAEAGAEVLLFQNGDQFGSVTAGMGGSFVFNDGLPVTDDGVYTYTATQSDLAGNASATSNSLAITIDTVGPTVTYNGTHYDPNTNVLTIQGTGFNGLGANGASVTTLIQNNASALTWNIGVFSFGPSTNIYALQAGDVTSATVVDDRTLLINLNGGGFFVGDVEGDAFFGSAGNLNFGQELPEFINIGSGLVGTDVAGNPGTGSATGLTILGAQNGIGVGFPQSFSANLANAAGAVNDTLGEQAGTLSFGEDSFAAVNLDFFNNGEDGGYEFDSLILDGISAAQVSLENYGYFGGSLGDTYLLTQASALGSVGDSFNQLLVYNAGEDGFDSTSGNFGVSFADGSVLIENVFGSDTLTGTRFDDQLLASGSGDRLLGNAGNDLLIGGNGADAIYGGTGNDIIYGDGGNDYLVGGSGTDTFIYTAIPFDSEGYDVISGFGTSDVINVVGGGSAAAVRALAQQSGSDTLIVLNSNETIRLLGVTTTNLTDANFAVNEALIRGENLAFL